MSTSDAGWMHQCAQCVRRLRDDEASDEHKSSAAARLRYLLSQHWPKIVKACRMAEVYETTRYSSAPEYEDSRAAKDCRRAAETLVAYEILEP